MSRWVGLGGRRALLVHVDEGVYSEIKHPRGRGGRWTPAFHARMETSHFTFDAFGPTEGEARESMRRAWLRHAEETGADASMADNLESEWGVSVEPTGLKRPGGHIATYDGRDEHLGYGATAEAAARQAKSKARRAGERRVTDENVGHYPIRGRAMRDTHPVLDERDEVREGVYTEVKHPRGRGGKWTKGAGAVTTDGSRAASLGLPERPVGPFRGKAKERVEAKDWQAPPPPAGGRGVRKAGGYSSDDAFGTNTALGRVGEEAFLSIVGGRILHPEGKGEQSPLDVHYDGYGFEVKAVSRRSLGYKATPKPYEIDQKEAHARELGLKPALAIVVVDSETGEAHAYFRDGLKGGRLSQGTGWRYLGSARLRG